MPPTLNPDAVYLAASVDAEEEGLFTGAYRVANPPVANAPHLARMIPLLERGLAPTVFCAHSFLNDAAARAALDRLRDRGDVEIGAHLHHWNTPPLVEGAGKELTSVPSRELSADLFRKKMETLLRATRAFKGDAPQSFRMGRWDIHTWQFPILAELGIKCDASVRPLHSGGANGPDHFLAPRDPFRLRTPAGELFEAPLTVQPLHPDLGKLPSRPAFLRQSLKNWGALALLPTRHPLWLMKLAARTHLARGGRVLSLTWHSSEMMPHGAPHIKTEADANKLIAKISAWLEWLQSSFNVVPVTMSALREKLRESAPLVDDPRAWKIEQGLP